MKTGDPSTPFVLSLSKGERSLRAGPPPVLLLCIGPERWLQLQAIERLKTQCIAPGFEEMDLVRWPEPPQEPQVILEAVRTCAFGSPYRLVVVDGLSELSLKTAPWLPAYLNHPNPKACLSLCAQRLEPDIRPLFSKKKPGLIQIRWCHPLKGKELEAWILDQAKAAGAVIEPEAARLLVTRVGSELQSLALAVESLSLLVGESSRITAKDVEALIAPSVRETAFDILDHAAAGRLSMALETLRQALTQGRLTVEQLMGALGWYYRMVWKSQKGLASGFWISPNRQAALSRLMRWPEPKLREAFDQVLEADAALKLGHPAPELLADQLLLELSL